MDERGDIRRLLCGMEQQIKELEIAYEQYFAGVEKREPLRAREILTKRLRLFANRHIVQTDLRFRYQNLATRFHSYAGHWDRILRLIEEGRYSRQQGILPKSLPTSTPPEATVEAAAPQGPTAEPAGREDFEAIYQNLVAAHQACNLKVPQRQKVEEFLTQQQDKIREKFGERPVEFRVEMAGGKPKLKVRAKA